MIEKMNKNLDVIADRLTHNEIQLNDIRRRMAVLDKENFTTNEQLKLYKKAYESACMKLSELEERISELVPYDMHVNNYIEWKERIMYETRKQRTSN